MNQEKEDVFSQLIRGLGLMISKLRDIWQIEAAAWGTQGKKRRDEEGFKQKIKVTVQVGTIQHIDIYSEQCHSI